MNDEQRRMMRHAIGLTRGRKRTSRNRYCSPLNGPVFEAWEDIAKHGFAEGPFPNGRTVMFYVTREGADAVREKGETLDPEDFA